MKEWRKPLNTNGRTQKPQDIVEDIDTGRSDVEKSVALELARESLEKRKTEHGFRCYLIGVDLQESEERELQESLTELAALVRTLGDECAGVSVQRRAKIDPATFIGSGKAEEIRERCQNLKISYVAFDCELTPTHVRNLEKIVKRPVLDRAEVILQIFRQNAKSKEAKTQVEIARLEYLLPRISNAWIAFERQRGGSGGAARTRGSGEAQLELERRRMREKISHLRKDLEKVQKEKETQRKSRQDEPLVVLVGYTNAGKTTLMNALTESTLSAKNALFETLDSSVRILKGSKAPRILLADTVGFIRNLPHALIASFQSTLDETADADLLLQVVDVSHPSYKDHIRITDDVLKEVGAGDVPKLIVFNKLDELTGEPRLEKILKRIYPRSLCISANRPNDVERCQDAIFDFFSESMVEWDFEVEYEDSKLLSSLYTHTRVVSVDWKPEHAQFRVRATRETLSRHFGIVFDSLEKAPLPQELNNQIRDPWDSGEFSLETNSNASDPLETADNNSSEEPPDGRKKTNETHRDHQSKARKVEID